MSSLLLNLALPPILLVANPLKCSRSSQYSSPGCHHGDVVSAGHGADVVALRTHLLILFFLLLSVRILFPLDKNWINKEKICHVKSEEADDKDDHAHDDLDYESISLLISTNAARTKCFRQPFHMILNVKTWDDNILAITMIRGNILDIDPPGFGLR